MRYFTKELWLRINSCDGAVRHQAENEWRENSKLYQQEFEITKKHIPYHFLENFLLRHGFHDYTILGIIATNNKGEYSCEVQLTNEVELVCITMIGLKAMRIGIDSFDCCMQGNLTWGYCEFMLTPRNNIQLTILCDMQNELQFEFETIELSW